MDRSIHYSDDPAAGGRTNCDVAALLDPWEFSRPPRLPPKQAATLDPAHRMALELGQRTVDALADTWLPREHTGVWIANAGGAFQTLRAAIAHEASARWAARAAELRPDLRATIDGFNREFRARYPHPREEAAINGNILSGRLTNYFDLRGPQRSVDAGGASSMAALRNACLSLEDGSCAMAFVGSVGTLAPEQLVMMSKSGMVAARRSFPFDKTACGYVPAEGGVMVALVRAEDAAAHGLPVLGVIRAIGASFDGPVPPSASGGGRRLAITRAWEEGEFDPDGADGRIDYIEAQGTGVRAGDAAEYSALLETYGKALPDGPLPFGSITSVVGYAAETAGLAGLLRALYVFDRGRLPPTVGVTAPAAYVLDHHERFRLVRGDEPLPPGRGVRRVAINSFGLDGVAFHAIVEWGAAAEAPPAAPRSGGAPVAIVAMSAIMPDAPDVAAVWEHLRGGTAVTAPLHDRIPGFADHFSEDPSDRDRTVCPAASIVEPQPLREPARWQVPPEDAGRMFADHVLLLNAASQLIAAGAVPDAPATRDRAGVFVTDLLDSDGRHAVIRAVMFERWWTELRRALAAPAAGASPYGLAELEAALRGDAELDLGRVTDDVRAGGQGVVNAARVAAGLGLSGTAVAVNSACASGLAALSMAMQELRAGSLDFALVGGASMGIDPYNQVALSAIGSLSPSGRGRPYDKDADGFVIGTGAVWFALKRLSDAERDRDEIVAVVLECLGTSDGKGRSIIAPSVRGRREVLRRAYRAAGVDPRTVQYVEGHGAGSRLGDATELDAIAAEMGHEMGAARPPITLGSVKGNYGHLKAPAALAGLLKVVLCLRERTIVPTPGLCEPGDLAGFRDGGVRHAGRPERWPRDGGAPRRAGLNAFGLGGTNYHAIVEEYLPRPPAGSTISAATREELARRVAEGAAGGRGEWRAALLTGGRAARSSSGPAQRSRLAAEIRAGTATCLGKVTEIGAWAGRDARTGPVALLFPGQAGTRHFGAVGALAHRLPEGATILRQVEDVLGGPGRLIRRALDSGDLRDLGRLRRRSGTSQILGFVASELMTRWFRERTGDGPGAPGTALIAVGHSAGEFAALVAGGSLRVEDALRLCWTRGELAEQVIDGRPGLMAALFAGPGIAEELIGPVPGAYLATVNGPGLCVVAGWADAVGRVIDRAAERRVEAARLDISVPFHTPLLREAVDHFRRSLAEVEFAAPTIPIYSAVLGRPYPGDADAMRDAIAELYVARVRLDRLIRDAADAGARRFVECGVGRSLSRAVDAVLAEVPHVALAGAAGAADLDRLAAGLWVTGLERDLGRDDGSAPAADAGPGFRAFTAVAVPAEPYAGDPWTAQRILVAVATEDAHSIAAGLASALAGKGARAELVVVREPARGSGAPAARETGVKELAAREVAALLSAGGRSLIWVSVPGAAVRYASGAVRGERVMRELAALRTVAAGLSTGWARSEPGCFLAVTALDGRLGAARAGTGLACGALAGFMRSFSQEHPGARMALLDVGTAGGVWSARDVAGRIVGIGRPPSGHHELGLGSSAMWTVELTPLPLEPLAEEPVAEEPPPYGREPARGGRGRGVLDALTEPGAAVVVSGGTTGIVAHMLVSAAERTAGPLRGRLVLLSRTPAAEDGVEDRQEPVPADKGAALLAWRRANPGRSVHEFNDDWRRRSRAGETRRTLSRLARAGVEVEHHLVDVRSEKDVRALAERLRADHLAIRTIVHGAGIERSSRITDKPAAEWAETAAVKIMGFHHLVDVAGDALRLVVVHGSMLGSAAVPGQTDYAAANEYLSHAVARLRIERPYVTALYLGWPPWKKVGMAADAHTRRRLEERGARYIEPAEGDRWAAAAIADAASLPPNLVLLPTGGGSLPPARVSRHDPPADRWWLVDTVLRKGEVTLVDRLYDVTDPRDAELADHRVRGGIRVSAAQVVEQLAEAFVCTLSRSPRAVELRNLRLRQGLVLSSSGRRPTRVVVEWGDAGTGRTARDRSEPAAARAGLRLETTPMLRGDVPGPCQVVVATALAVASESFPCPSDRVDVSALRPAGTQPGAGTVASPFGVEYSGRFAAPVTPLRHPLFAAAASVDPGPRPARCGRALTDIPAVDLAIRTILAVPQGNGSQGMPSSAERVVLDLRPRSSRARHVFVTVRPDGNYDVILTDEEGGMVMRIENLHLELPIDHRR